MSAQANEPAPALASFPPETTIEGDKICVYAGKINLDGLPFVYNGSSLFSVKATRGSRAGIERAYSDLSGKPEFCRAASMQVGAEIAGMIISACGRKIQRPAHGTSGSRKSDHSGQEQRLSDGAVATVRQSRTETLILDEPRRMIEAAARAIQSA